MIARAPTEKPGHANRPGVEPGRRFGGSPRGGFTAGDVLSLQRAIGNRAVSRCVLAHSQKAPARSLQRLIAVNTAAAHGQPHTDYAIMKQVQQLRKVHRKPVVMMDALVNFSNMEQGEELYIVSHGDAATGEMRDLSVNQLLALLNHNQRGVPAHISGITLLSCYGGRVIAPRIESYAQAVANGLTHRLRVKGAVGFSFGSPEFGATGQSSVMPEELRAIYSADDIDAMATAWEQRHPTHPGGVLTTELGLHSVSPQQTILQIVQNKVGAGQAHDRIKGMMKKLQSEIKRIEHGLADLLATMPGDSVPAKAAAFEDKTQGSGGQRHRAVGKWDKLIRQQYELFTRYYLWVPANAGAFASFTR
jgi:hypothetical protein